MSRVGRPRQTQCKRGHVLEDPNVYYSSSGRSCKTCAGERYQENKAKVMRYTTIGVDEMLIAIYSDVLAEGHPEQFAYTQSIDVFWDLCRPDRDFQYQCGERQTLVVPGAEVTEAVQRSGFRIITPERAFQIGLVVTQRPAEWVLKLMFEHATKNGDRFPPPNLLISLPFVGRFFVDGDQLVTWLKELSTPNPSAQIESP